MIKSFSDEGGIDVTPIKSYEDINSYICLGEIITTLSYGFFNISSMYTSESHVVSYLHRHTHIHTLFTTWVFELYLRVSCLAQQRLQNLKEWNKVDLPQLLTKLSVSCHVD